MTVNKVILIGNLGRDPEARTTPNGFTVAKLNLATTDRQKDKDGNWTDHTEWHRVVVFGKSADTIVKYAKKGKTLYIEGRLKTDKWQDKDGNDRYTTEIVADNFRFVGGGGGGGRDSGGDEGGGYSGGGGGGGGGGGYSSGGGAASGGGNSGGGGYDGGDDDIPF